MKFEELCNTLTKRGYDWHRERIITHTRQNVQHIRHSIREIEPDAKPVLVVSAGPSLYKQNILPRLRGRFSGTIIATDGAYVQCLKAGVIPDYVLTLDPHPTRMVRWFGDPDIERNMEGDDYFERQDLDVAFRENALATNAQNIALVNHWAAKTRFVVATTTPPAVVARLQAIEAACFWFVPLVDAPQNETSLTRNMVRLTDLPAMNTGGTVGTAAWVFAHSILKSPLIGVVGMDMGYAMDTPFKETQSYNMLKDYPNLHEMYPHYTGPWGEAYTDPTYFWYRSNFLDLLKANKARIVNASEAGLLFGDDILCTTLDQWLAYSS